MNRTEAGALVWAVMPAAGAGRRFGDDLPKQYSRLDDRTLIEHALDTLLAEPRIAGVVVALADGDKYWSALPLAADLRVLTVTGGAERHLSVLQAVQAVPAAGDPWVAVHDAARPCLDAADLARLLDGLDETACGRILASPMADTLKQVNEAGQVQRTLAREGLWRAQTPQVFRREQLLMALQACEAQGLTPTDEAMAVEQVGGRVAVVAARSPNPKVTTRGDLQLAQSLIARGNNYDLAQR